MGVDKLPIGRSNKAKRRPQSQSKHIGETLAAVSCMAMMALSACQSESSAEKINPSPAAATNECRSGILDFIELVSHLDAEEQKLRKNLEIHAAFTEYYKIADDFISAIENGDAKRSLEMAEKLVKFPIPTTEFQTPNIKLGLLVVEKIKAARASLDSIPDGAITDFQRADFDETLNVIAESLIRLPSAFSTENQNLIRFVKASKDFADLATNLLAKTIAFSQSKISKEEYVQAVENTLFERSNKKKELEECIKNDHVISLATTIKYNVKNLKDLLKQYKSLPKEYQCE